MGYLRALLCKSESTNSGAFSPPLLQFSSLIPVLDA